MRNLKKLLAVIVAICVLASFTVPAFAATSASFTYADQAKKLYDMKLYAGNSATSYVPDLGSKLTREQGIILLVRMFGKEKDALAMTDADTVLAKYTDAAKVSSWAKKYVAYAVKTTMVSGTTATTLDAAGKLTGNAMATMILKNLGFTVDPATYATNAATLSSKGGLTADEATKFASKELIRDDVVGIMFGSLKAKDSNGKVVIDNLVASGAVSADAAKAAGVYTSVALDVSSAVAINSKVVALTLGKAATAADVSGATFVVKDSAAKEIKVTSSTLAAYDTDSKTVLLTLEADTAVGTLYTLTIGAKTINFGGKAVDTTKPEIIANGAVSTDYNEMTIEFNEPIKLDGAVVTIAEKYGTKAALAVTNISYDGNKKLKVTTADQKESTLYSVTVSGVQDFAGNAMDKDEAKTFVGKKKSDAKLTISSAEAIDYNKVLIIFNEKVDTTKIAASTYTVTEQYGTKATITASNPVAATEDDIKATTAYSGTLTDAQKNEVKALAKKAVVITTADLKASTLYKVVVAGLGTAYGQPMSTTSSDVEKTFVGKAKPTDSFVFGIPTTNSNTEVQVVFDRKVVKELAENIANYTITEAYGTKAALTISKAALDTDGKTVKLTVSSMKSVLYKMAIANIKDIYGNAMKTGSDAEKTFVGVAIAAKITDVKAALDNSDPTKLVLTFDQPVSSDATDVSKYVINKGIGYPISASKDGRTVTLIIPKTIDGDLYEIVVKNLNNSDGIAMDAAGVKTTFVGRGNNATLAKVEYVVATDYQTIKIYFDRDVDGASVKGATKVWNSNLLVAGRVQAKFDGTTYRDLSDYKHYAWRNAAEPNVLNVRIDPTISGADAPFTQTVNGVNHLDIFKGTTSLDFKFINAYFDGDSDVTITAARTSTEVVKPEIIGVLAEDQRNVVVYFNGPIKTPTAADFDVYESDDYDGTPAKVASAATITKVDATTYRLGFATDLTPAKAGSDSQYYLYIDSAELLDPSGYIAAKNDSDAKLYEARIFGASTTKNVYTSGVSAAMVNNKQELEVYFTEPMDENDVENSAYYTLYDVASAGTAIANTIESVVYDSDNNKAILYMTSPIAGSTTNQYYVQFSTSIRNATHTKNIAKDSDLNALRIQFAPSTVAAPAPALASASFNGETKVLTIKFDREVVVANAVNATAAQAATPNADQFSTANDGADIADSTLLAGIEIKAVLAGSSTAVVLDASKIADGVKRKADNKTLEVTIIPGLQPGTDINLKVLTDDFVSRTHTVAKTGSDASTAVAGVASTVPGLASAPTIAKDTTFTADDTSFDVTFTADATYAAAITAVTVSGGNLTSPVTLLRGAGVTVGGGNNSITIAVGNGGASQVNMTKAGDYSIAVSATGYTTATLTQGMAVGALVGTVSPSGALAKGATRTVTVTAKDADGNVISGYVFKINISTIDTNSTTDEKYTIAGVERSVDAAGVALTATNASGVTTFDITVPSTVDTSDGVSVQVKLNDGTTNVGTAVGSTF